MQPFDNVFLKELEDYSDCVQQYEDGRLQYYGRKVIPLESLSENAMNHMRVIQKHQSKSVSGTKGTEDPYFRDLLLGELAKWFNQHFFTWIDTLPCKICGRSDGQKQKAVENGIRVEVKYYRHFK